MRGLRVMTGFAPRLAAPAVALSLALASPALAAEDVVIVYDASGSMWGQIDGTSKVEIARNVMADLVEGWDENTNLGLVAYGHRRQGDCADIETLITPGPVDRAGFIATVNAIRPVGKTPLTESVRQAAELLSWRDNPATVVLISDGLETCNADPCALSAELAQQGVDFTAHVVGFDLEDADHASLACIAESTGGLFVPAGNAAELQEALTRVTTAVETPAPEPEPEPEPAPDPEPDLPEVTLRGPEQVTTGAAFEFYWSATIHPRDYITIVPVGADEGTYTSYIRTDKASRGSLVAPATPGLYELRYVQDEGGATLASAPVEVVEAEVSLTGPEQVTTGANFDFNWSNAIHPRDYITIVPAGADEGTHTSYIRVDKNTQGSLVAPSAPGLYELRYVLAEGARTLASAPVEVVEAEVSLTGPEQVTTGANFDFNWSNAI
ncbi:vWA domain-containing protein, partial [Pontibaca methylaminivorans]|uniref:vWA domain-containing protein n=1 Tax=Pontibaca methylaminivorans TaxID=515897 RepID=UPI002FD8CFC6